MGAKSFMTAHYVYRVYDHDDQLIYVGCTSNLFVRLSTHQISTWWAYQAKRVVAKVYPDKYYALSVERRIIQDEHPRWNLNGQSPRQHWTKQHYIDFVTALTNQSEITPRSLMRMRSVGRHYLFRFGEHLPVAIPDEAAVA